MTFESWYLFSVLHFQIISLKMITSFITKKLTFSLEGQKLKGWIDHFVSMNQLLIACFGENLFRTPWLSFTSTLKKVAGRLFLPKLISNLREIRKVIPFDCSRGEENALKSSKLNAYWDFCKITNGCKIVEKNLLSKFVCNLTIQFKPCQLDQIYLLKISQEREKTKNQVFCLNFLSGCLSMSS